MSETKSVSDTGGPTGRRFEPFAGVNVGAVYYRRHRVGLRGKLAVLEVLGENDGPIRLTDAGGREVFSYLPSELHLSLVSRKTFRLRYGEDRWWLWGTGYYPGRYSDRKRNKINREDVTFVLPRNDLDPDRYERLMNNIHAQQLAWCGVWYFRLIEAGVQLD